MVSGGVVGWEKAEDVLCSSLCNFAFCMTSSYHKMIMLKYHTPRGTSGVWYFNIIISAPVATQNDKKRYTFTISIIIIFNDDYRNTYDSSNFSFKMIIKHENIAFALTPWKNLFVYEIRKFCFFWSIHLVH